MNLRRIIKEELDDGFDWVRDIEVDTDLTPAQIKMKYDTFPLEVVGPNMPGFRDIHWEGGKLMLYIDHWEDLAELFVDNDSSQYGYVTKWLAEKVLAEDDYWEPYYDLIQDWQDDVWDLVTDNKELLDYIKNYIRKNAFIGQELDNEDLGVDDFKEDMLLNSDLLGELIETEPIFEDLKNDLSWAYESAYNVAARDEIVKETYGALKDLFGKGEWTSVGNDSRGRTRHMLKFDVTDLVMSSVEDDIDHCLESCKRYFDPERHFDEEEHESETEAFEEFCEECHEYPFTEWGDFVSFYRNYLYERDDLLNPRFSEWPDSDDVAKFFVEDIYSRF